MSNNCWVAVTPKPGEVAQYVELYLSISCHQGCIYTLKNQAIHSSGNQPHSNTLPCLSSTFSIFYLLLLFSFKVIGKFWGWCIAGFFIIHVTKNLVDGGSYRSRWYCMLGTGLCCFVFSLKSKRGLCKLAFTMFSPVGTYQCYKILFPFQLSGRGNSWQYSGMVIRVSLWDNGVNNSPSIPSPPTN